MKICVPVKDNSKLSSKVSEHFGSAPFFSIVDTESKNCIFIANTNQHHTHGMCQPLTVLADVEFDAIIVGGIGMGALNKLKAGGKKVMKTKARDLNEVLEAHEKNSFIEVTSENACSSHSCE